MTKKWSVLTKSDMVLYGFWGRGLRVWLKAKLPKLTNHVTAEGAEREEIFKAKLPRLTGESRWFTIERQGKMEPQISPIALIFERIHKSFFTTKLAKRHEEKRQIRHWLMQIYTVFMRSCFGLLGCLYAVSSLETSFCETPASVTGRRGRPAIVMAAGRNAQI